MTIKEMTNDTIREIQVRMNHELANELKKGRKDADNDLMLGICVALDAIEAEILERRANNAWFL